MAKLLHLRTYWIHLELCEMFEQEPYLHENNYGDDGIADGEDAPEHPDGLAVAHELVGVVVRRLAVLQLRLHTDTKPLLL